MLSTTLPAFLLVSVAVVCLFSLATIENGIAPDARQLLSVEAKDEIECVVENW